MRIKAELATDREVLAANAEARSPGVSVDPALAALLGKDQRARLQVVVRFVGTRVRPGPASTLVERREEAAKANSATIGTAIAQARKTSGETPTGTRVFGMVASVYLEATPVFIKALVGQPGVVAAAMNKAS